MQSHDYRVVPAPRRGLKAKGLRRPEDRFANAIEAEMNRLAREGWEYVRTDTLPHEHKRGWFSRPVTEMRTVLVFRRPRAEASQPTLAAQTPDLYSATPLVAIKRPPPVMVPPAEAARPVAPSLHVVEPPGDPRQAAEPAPGSRI